MSYIRAASSANKNISPLSFVGLFFLYLSIFKKNRLLRNWLKKIKFSRLKFIGKIGSAK